MLKIQTEQLFKDCDGVTRRNFLRIGGFGLGALGLSGLIQARALAAQQGKPTRKTSVVWLWLAGGATHIETFNPNMTAPSEYRSATGEVHTNLPGVTLGGHFRKTARVADKMAFVRSFAHRNSGHGGGTHWVMTGYDNRKVDNGGVPNRPAIGSILSRVRGANHPQSGMPTYVKLGGINYDGPTFLGQAFAPFSPRGEAKRNLTLNIERKRLQDRKHLLTSIDRIRHNVDSTGMMEGMDRFSQQAMDVVLGNAASAFDVRSEDPKVVKRYGKGLGQQMLAARRLCEAGCGFVTISYGGWDMHGKIATSMNRRGPELDHAIATFVRDVAERGLTDDILLVVTGEFGRTPKINKNQGRDHWAPLSTLALSGGGLNMGQVVGESAPKADVPKSPAITPQDLMATIFSALGIEHRVHFKDHFGRPVYMITDGKPISELV